ncbi:MAG TPA: hypothetical protein VLA43_12750, partial [Longimicrobiales bacterium]|nr:hypothetical protein [Longimicrobiales bacterium]
EAPLTLLLQAAPPRGVWPAPTALAGVAAHHRRGEAASLGDGEPGVRLETGVEEMDSGVLWARAWIRDRLLTVPGAPPGVHAPPNPFPAVGGVPAGTGGLGGPALPGGAAAWFLPGSEAAWLLMGSAASGDWEAGRGALSALGWDSPRVALLSALALARWAAWTGEARPLLEHQARLAGLFAPSGLLTGVEPRVAAAVRRAVEAAGEAGQATGTAVPVLPDPAAPPATPAPPPPSGGVRRLPVVADRAAHAGPPLLFLPGREDVPVDLRLREALEVREVLGAVAGAPHLLGTGMGAVVLQGLVAGMLGASPDAGYGRLTLSPLLPPGWRRFRVGGIRTGEGALGLDYRRDGGVVRWTLRPQEGSVPLMVVFEPWQPVTGIGALRVDGAPAELDVTEEGGWSRVRIQIPADGTRVVELEGTTEGRP